jgi:hypothetical protein
MNVSRQPYGKIVWLKWPADHFPQVVNMVRIGSSTKREIEDFELSRYACYLIEQNGKPMQARPILRSEPRFA